MCESERIEGTGAGQNMKRGLMDEDRQDRESEGEKSSAHTPAFQRFPRIHHTWGRVRDVASFLSGRPAGLVSSLLDRGRDADTMIHPSIHANTKMKTLCTYRRLVGACAGRWG